MRLPLFFTVTAALSGCAPYGSRLVTQGSVESHRVWFAEVTRGTGSEKAATVVIVCDAQASPPCIRFAPADVDKSTDVQRWLVSARVAEATASRGIRLRTRAEQPAEGTEPATSPPPGPPAPPGPRTSPTPAGP
jgi:hypothetical protein